MAIGDKVYIADKQTLDDIKGKIGTTTDTGGTTTAGGIFAKLNAILQQFLSNWTVARAVKIDTISSGVINLSNRGVVKSVQRGNVEDTALPSGVDYLDITVSNVNENKSTLSACSRGYLNDNGERLTRYEVINNTTIRIYANSGGNPPKIENLSWQLTEFY